MHLREIWTQVDADKEQGFDEFMNLVIDDAVEVTLANAKKETSEERRSIGAY
jgi:small nuclear ribonucleoprotein E